MQEPSKETKTYIQEHFFQKKINAVFESGDKNHRSVKTYQMPKSNILIFMLKISL